VKIKTPRDIGIKIAKKAQIKGNRRGGYDGKKECLKVTHPNCILS
jgi:hypothetical protein